MSEDIAEKIMCVIAENFGDTGAIDPNDILELMDELEKCRAENIKLRDSITNIGEIMILRDKTAEEQYKRATAAEAMWQETTGKHNTIPGLGVLLDWLMGEINDAEDHIKWLRHIWWQEKEELKKLKRMKTGNLNGLLLAEIGKQRRHRKWLLKKARNNLEVIYGIANHG